MRALVAIALLLAGLPSVAQAAAGDILINNGLAPPNPANVIDDFLWEFYNINVRNVGCGTVNVKDPCAAPGDPTEVELADGGAGHNFVVRDTSIGTITGGFLDDDIMTWDSSSVTITGGGLDQKLRAHDTSTIVLVGVDFKVDGFPVPYGPISVMTGQLTGTLALQDTINTAFFHAGYSQEATGIISLEEPAGPPPVAAPLLPPWGWLALASGLLAIAVQSRVSRRPAAIRAKAAGDPLTRV